MSRTTLYGFGADGTIERHIEFSNSSGSASRVWDSLAVKYLDWEPFTWVNHRAEPLWKLWKHLHVPEQQRAVLLSTFDRATVAAGNFVRMAEAFEAFDAALPTKPEYSNHLPVIAETLRQWAGGELIAAAWQQTSVSEDLWYPWNADTEESESYNLLSGTDHFEVFEKLSRAASTEGAGLNRDK